MVSRTILGDRLLIDPDQVDKAEDSKKVFYYDLPVGPDGPAGPEQQRKS
jgi:hypothetical protein